MDLRGYLFSYIVRYIIRLSRRESRMFHWGWRADRKAIHNLFDFKECVTKIMS